LTIESNRENSLAPVKYPDLDLEAYKAAVTRARGIEFILTTLLDKFKMRALWDFVVDPDGA
jgi:hypothetical protein